MPNPIDLCTLSQCRLWLGIASAQSGNAAEVMVVNTYIEGETDPGSQTVTPASMAQVQVNAILGIDVGTPVEEYVAVIAVSGTTFTALFQNTHADGATVIDATDTILGRLITSVATYWLWYTGKINSDGSIPTTSPLNSQVAYSEWYDGNGNTRLFLRQSPVVSVAAAYVNGVQIPQSVVSSVGSRTPGWVIDQNGRSLAMITNGYYGGRFGYNSYLSGGAFSPIYAWNHGIQNINIQYTAGYTSTPPDVNDHATRMVGLAYRRKSWIGLKSTAHSQEMSLQLDLSAIPEDTRIVLEYYKRIAQAG